VVKAKVTIWAESAKWNQPFLVFTLKVLPDSNNYEYGRYDSENRGVVRSFSVPNVDIDKNGKPTTKSLNTVMVYVYV